ncbi:reverse transcriptase family protein [uncultured Friedmanniella sp.]|uniref:reverse transcriptase family protein n=1 Tax=uncultured Friedmanniella sp. TaxID=335381 RepID=UPI0035CA9911
MSSDSDGAVARALSWAFLAADGWTVRSLRAAAGRTLGPDHRWTSAVARDVLAEHPTPPLDRPYALAELIAGLPAFAEGLERDRRRQVSVRVRSIPTVPGTMGRRSWPVPVLDDLPALAALLEVPEEQLPWLADVQGRQRRRPEGPLRLYRYRWVRRPGAVPRLLEVPTPILRAVLRRLLGEVLVWVPLHPAAYGFVRGRSALDHARCHVGADLVVSLDLRHFFAAVGAARVAGLFRRMGYPDGVVPTLTGLVTHRTPVGVLSGMPSGGDSSSRALLRARLRAPHLPQGAPTSPALANLACFALDRRLAGYAEALGGATYSRYADDLVFSGPASLRSARLVQAVSTIVAQEAFTLNPAKTRVQRSSQRQLVTGIVVNEQLGVPREDEDRLRAVLHEAGRSGPEVANRQQHPDFRAHLEGRVGWVESVNPVRGRRLRRQLEAIRWPAEDGRDIE